VLRQAGNINAQLYYMIICRLTDRGNRWPATVKSRTKALRKATMQCSIVSMYDPTVVIIVIIIGVTARWTILVIFAAVCEMRRQPIRSLETICEFPL
jgi:hypothetical protein